MFNTLQRGQTVFGFFTTVAFVVAALIAGTDLITPRIPSGKIQPTNLQVVRGRPHYYSTRKEEYAILRFDLDADLSSLFTWNTKQLFVYITAEWPGSLPASSNPSSPPSSSGSTSATAAGSATSAFNATNQAVIWDAIITSPSADHLQNIGPIAMKKLVKSAGGKKLVPERGVLKLRNQKPKYQIGHPSGKIAEQEGVVLRLHYNVQPWVGLLTWEQEGNYGVWKAMKGGVSRVFDLPGIKVKKDKDGKGKS